MSTVTPNVDQLSHLLEEDILRRKLCAGDRFMTSDEAGRKFGVSRATAHRAFQLLAGRDLLVSKPRQGTFVGPASPHQKPAPPELRCVHAVIDPERLRAGLSVGELVEGIHTALPEHDFQLNYLPTANPVGYITSLLREVSDDGDEENQPRRGFVLLGCPRRVQELVAESCLPAVIFGSRYPTAASIPSISVDNVAKGRLLTRYLLERDHRRIGLVMRETWLPGDRRVFEGINQELAEAELPHGTLSICTVPNDDKVIYTELCAWLKSNEPPTALICQQRFTEAVQASLRQLECRVPEDLEVVVETTDHVTDFTRGVPHTLSQVPFLDRVKRAGELLSRVFRGEEFTTTEILPVTVVAPE